MQNAHSLRTLTASTVLAIEDVAFTEKAASLPAVKLTTSSFVSEIYDPEEVLSTLPLVPDIERRMVVMENAIIVGGLCFDSDTSSCNPFESDGEGTLYHYGRRAKDDNERSSFFRALGFDSYGNEDLNDERVLAQLVERATVEIRKDRSVMTTLSNLLRWQGKPAKWAAVAKLISDAIYREGWEFALDYVAQWCLGVSWWADVTAEWKRKLARVADLLCEREAYAAWERASLKGDIGNSLAVPLDIYEHGGIVYSVAGTGMQCRWDTARVGAVWVPDTTAEENIRYNVLKQLGLGVVSWFGSAGSKDEPLHTRYSLDDGLTWIGRFDTWTQAMNAMVEASTKEIDAAALDALLSAEAKRYCKGVLYDYNAWVNGEVYGLVIYTIDPESGLHIASEDHASWGYIGSEYAEKELESTILNLVVKLGNTLH
jgi:hypothetical protein